MSLVSDQDLNAGAKDTTLEICALSRPLHLGTLYNARNDTLIPGIRLWKHEDIMRKTKVQPQPETKFQVSVSESLRDKMDLLDVSASVKLSFYGGLIEAGGSAHYLKKMNTSTHQCSVTLKYHMTTEVRELIISELGAPDPEGVSGADGTHVVTQVLYGADALMEFQQQASDESNKQEIEGNLNMMIKKVPSVEISGDGSLNMNDEDKEKVENCHCKFYGDFQLKDIPSTYEEAVKVYKLLPSLLGENGEKAVPVKVWLYPLSKLSNTESKLKRMISETLVLAVEKQMDDFHQAEIKTNDLLKKSKEIKAEDIVTKLEKFQGSLRGFTVEFLQRMTDLIPAIRGGDMEETKLRELLNSQNATGFSGNEMKKWLDGKETEINVVTSYINKIKCDIKSPGRELDSYLMSPDVTDAFVFSFTSLKYEEPYLDKISQTAKSFRNGSTISTTEQNPPEKVPWYRREVVKKTLDFSVRFITKALLKNKVISFIPDSEHLGASVHLYHNTGLKANACYLTLDPNSASRRVRLSEGNRKATRMGWLYPDHPDRFDDDTGQVLSREPLIGRCYWEWEWSGSGVVAVGVAYKSISRRELIAHSAKAWSLWCDTKRYFASDNSILAPPSDSRRVGVCVDREAGTVSFYSVSSDTHTHWHTYNITHTDEPLHAAIGVGDSSSVSLV